jgi:four helix bundle protein
MKNPRGWFIAEYAQELLVEVYRFLATLPPSERDNYFDQIQRAATSIDNNIGDGAGRQGDRALLPFLYHVNASATELVRCFKACRNLQLGDQAIAKRLSRKAGRMQVMAARFIRTVEADIAAAEGVTIKPRRRRSRRRMQ